MKTLPRLKPSTLADPEWLGVHDDKGSRDERGNVLLAEEAEAARLEVNRLQNSD